MKITKSVAFLLLFSFLSLELFAGEPKFNTASDGVFIHISSGPQNPASVLMALTLALKMVEDHDVYIFFDLEGVNVPLGSSRTMEHKKFEHSKLLMDKIIAKGGQIGVCEICLVERGKTQFDLIKGAKLASKEDFFNFTSGRIISLSY
ncbi:MAG: DsrE family protein [Melioribacteraceae bacterium]|nr:DsrE family protein [Melioribacteraceae bacterium]